MVYLIVWLAELVVSLVLVFLYYTLACLSLLIFLQGAFVNVAYFEQFGVTLIEAAMNGLPIIATKKWGTC